MTSSKKQKHRPHHEPPTKAETNKALTACKRLLKEILKLDVAFFFLEPVAGGSSTRAFVHSRNRPRLYERRLNGHHAHVLSAGKTK